MLIELREYGENSGARLSANEAHVLASTGLVETVRTEDPGWWELRPGGKVGVVRVGALEVRVAPKVAIDRIIFMLGYRLRGVTWLDAPVPVESAEDVVHVLAEILTRAVADAIRPGMLQGYRVTEESAPVVRGRIRIDEQLKRRPGVWLPLEVAYDDFTVDIPENQLLRAALERMQRNALVPGPIRRRMSGLLLQFADVSRLVPGAPLPQTRITRLNRRYEVALELSRLVLNSSSFEHRIGDTPVDGFVLDVPKIFEDFVAAALRDALPRLSPGSSVQWQYTTTLDEEGLIDLRPDVVWLNAANSPIAVVDAKYKSEKPSGFPNADTYQALAYATVMDLRDAHLVYAKGNEPVLTYQVRHSDIRIHAHALDLAQPPQALLAEIDELATRLAQSTLAHAVPRALQAEAG
jgi:5-methylcytosine-specific restriction enzyme subunit McrC